jgi:hypothetical protein
MNQPGNTGGARWNALSVLLATVFAAGLPAARGRAELVSFEILERKLVAEGQAFGEAGPYERIVGRVYYALDPQASANALIVDLDRAAPEADGRIHFFADLFILAPVQTEKSNGALLYDVNNRGNKLALRFFNDGSGNNDPLAPDDFGHGFLMRHGFTVVWSGWDGELLPGGNRLRLAAPRATAEDGSPLTGIVRCEFVPPAGTKHSVVNWDNHGSYWPTASGRERATMTVRERPLEPRRPVPREKWQLHVSSAGDDPWQLPKVEVEMPAGMQAGHIYELIYEAQHPLVMGVGLAAVRDLITALKHGEGRDNPLVRDGQSFIRRAHGFGVSQSGRFLREFTYWGCNRDERDRKVFDGLIPHVAGGGLGSFNHRFAQPTRHANQHDHHDYPADRFPFAYETQVDPYTGQVGGILQSLPAEFQPLVLHTQSSAEYWTRSGSLVHTDPRGTLDASPPGNVRIFAFGGTQHGPASYPPTAGNGKNLANPGDYRPFLRALLVALDRWSRDGVACPPSVYPTIGGGTLVDWKQQATGFPDLPDVRYPPIIQQPPVLDLGSRWNTRRIVDQQPPRILATYRTLVPRVDADGNDLGCLLPPEVAVPEATYTGWNLRRADVGAEDELVSLVGSYLPFPVTVADRQTSSDPRPAVRERYASLDEYLARVDHACRRLETAGYLLSEDRSRILARQQERLAPKFAD